MTSSNARSEPKASEARAERFIEDVKPGDALAPLVKRASRAQLFLFSAATHNPHRIHYDRDYARTEGHDDILVHGPLQGAWLHQYVRDWAGPRGRVLALSFQNRGRAFPERDLVFRGRVAALEGDVVALELEEVDDTGAVLMPASARVRLPRRGAALR
jgi:hydroxyacyl-ACP dehydratase HTD2-like protein with hotdog domain